MYIISINKKNKKNLQNKIFKLLNVKMIFKLSEQNIFLLFSVKKKKILKFLKPICHFHNEK